MLSSIALLLLACLVFASGVAAHDYGGFDLVDGLPKCWQKCLKATSCHSQSCICDASQSDSYLPNAVSSIATSCDTDSWVLDSTFIFPVKAYCDLIDDSIPDDVLSAAYAAATATTYATPLTTHKVQHTSKSLGHTTKSGEELKSTVTTTLTQTTTDKDGNTVQIIIPIVMGPQTISTGKIVTSTLEPEATATDAPSSAVASPSPTAAPNAASTQAQAAASPTSSAAAGGKSNSNGNGSPFENMQAGADRWSISGALVGLGLLAGFFMRL